MAIFGYLSQVLTRSVPVLIHKNRQWDKICISWGVWRAPQVNSYLVPEKSLNGRVHYEGNRRISGKRPQLWLTANKDRQEKSRQPRRAKSDKPPRLARAGKVGDVGCSPGLMRNEEVVTAWASWPSIYRVIYLQVTREISPAVGQIEGTSLGQKRQVVLLLIDVREKSRRNREGEEKAELESGFNFYARSPSGMPTKYSLSMPRDAREMKEERGRE
ncbi:hypothetical protein ASPFODRAFT_32453 [Aspergillus luchuensis CBS 106.47]|uniref:Uncharacterized protein n=1 Tax=Aspergillus luchuensis (strain CBS 106.47) TaxID=1137211 RepID=A0A1M3TMC3_ASPLC|nr:hypothetical protein ASPFODRAFT_32453 [Aspergillus luchuensis CBS 106.47]